MLPEADAKHIKKHLETKFEQALFESTLTQVTRPDDPLRANNFAYALRELSRHVLKRLAPDDEVRSAPWFIQDPNYPGITRPQRIKFAIQGHLEDAFMKSDLGIDYVEETKSLKEAIDDLNKFTHVEEATFGIPENEVADLSGGALTALAEMFRSMFDCRERTLQAVADNVDEAVVSHVVEETLEGFYDYATHYSTDEVIVENLALTGFDGDEIFGTVEGSVSVTLQYGSAGDRKRGDGFETDASANFSCNVSVLASDLKSISIEDGSFQMDYDELSRSWRGDSSDDDEEV